MRITGMNLIGGATAASGQTTSTASNPVTGETLEGDFVGATEEELEQTAELVIRRFVQPVAYQNWPDADLPVELGNDNPLAIRRFEDGAMTVEKIG